MKRQPRARKTGASDRPRGAGPLLHAEDDSPLIGALRILELLALIFGRNRKPTLHRALGFGVLDTRRGDRSALEAGEEFLVLGEVHLSSLQEVAIRLRRLELSKFGHTHTPFVLVSPVRYQASLPAASHIRLAPRVSIWSFIKVSSGASCPQSRA